jgi:hypothetical protein
MAGEVTFTLSESDYVAANRDWYLRYLRVRGTKFAAKACGAAALLGALMGFIQDGLDPITMVSFGIACAFIALLITPLLYGLCYLTYPRRARQLYRQHKNLHGPLRYAWSDRELSYDSATGTGSIAWSDLHRWSDGRVSFLFLVTDAMFHFIPKHALGEVEADDLRTVATRSGLPRF